MSKKSDKKFEFYSDFKKSYLISCKVLKEVANHPLVIFLALLSTILATILTVALYVNTKEQPIESLKIEIGRTIINMRLKIVNISEGCKSNSNTYFQVLNQNNQDRINLVAVLSGISKAADIRDTLGKRAFEQVFCFIQYNDSLSSKANICDGDFKTEKEMQKWEDSILYDLNHKSKESIICPYFNFEQYYLEKKD